ncbi:MAG: undecaprenyldiphospho-muramoylpentapeptide beta-N-acetylglucosaminyltransferase [Ignavibacteria bacterium]|nr:undecaprenyldiphospho-muramoylpentapeptide beta-N-acetylglucosaminyltransferase [Ignavibacteria bacterium]
MNDLVQHRILIAAGGTGGHLFPAIAIAEELNLLEPNLKLLFIGTKDKIESKVVPELGFDFKAILIKGMPRKISVSILIFIYQLIVSLIQSALIILKFKPDVALGTGSYVAFPPLFMAKVFNKPIVLAESNSLPGISIKLLSPIANQVHLTFEESKKYLKRKNNVFITGTPVRRSLHSADRNKSAEYFGLSHEKKTILVLGGSLGAKSINEKLLEIYKELNEYQIIWQTGKNYFNELQSKVEQKGIYLTQFIDRMDYAFGICDLLISRAGASTIAEIVNLGIASILIPSPNVAENHQYFNAMSLVKQNSAVMILDNESSSVLLNKINELMKDDNKLNLLRINSRKIANPNAGKMIANEILKLARR